MKCSQPTPFTIVVGSTGFLGRNLVKELKERNQQYLTLNRSSGFTSASEWLDFTRTNDLTSAHCVFLAAGGVGGKPSRDDYEFNRAGVVELLKDLNISGVTQFTIAGTCFEYGKAGENNDLITTSTKPLPTDPYGESKHLGFEAITRWREKVECSVRYLRLFQVTGDYESLDRVIPSAFRAALGGSDFIVRSGSNVRDFIGVSQVVKLILDEISPVQSLELRNVCSGVGISVGEIVRQIWRQTEALGELTVLSHFDPVGYLRLVGDPLTESGGIYVPSFDLRTHPQWTKSIGTPSCNAKKSQEAVQRPC